MWLSSFIYSGIPTVPKHLGCITEPFAVLRLSRLTGLYLTGGNKVFKLLLASYNAHGVLLAESKVRHNIKDILQ